MEQLPEIVEVVLILVLMGFWLALFIAAVFAGFEWEERSNRMTRGSTGVVRSRSFG